MQYSEMQVGDRVEITDRRTVTISKIDTGENAYDEDGRLIYASPDNKGITLGTYGTREFGLIERPIPALPTELGSIISVPHENPFANDDEFILISGMYTPNIWRGITSIASRAPREMEAQVKLRGGFKVLR